MGSSQRNALVCCSDCGGLMMMMKGVLSYNSLRGIVLLLSLSSLLHISIAFDDIAFPEQPQVCIIAVGGIRQFHHTHYLLPSLSHKVYHNDHQLNISHPYQFKITNNFLKCFIITLTPSFPIQTPPYNNICSPSV